MKTFPRTATTQIVGLSLALLSLMPVAVRAANETPPSPAAVFLASDFPSLAEGVRLGLAGVVNVWVWAPPGDAWRLENASGTPALACTHKGADPEPRWQSLGKLTLPQDGLFKLSVVDVTARDEKAASEDNKVKVEIEIEIDSSRTPITPTAPPVPAVLVLSTREENPPAALLDLVRGRVDSIEPSSDRRRAETRTNWEGADFQAPESAEAWRDRAAHLREQMLVTLGLWPMFPKTPLNPVIGGKLDRGDYTIEKVVLETFPGFTLSGNLYRPAHSNGRIPALLCPHGHWDDGRVNPEVQQRCIRWAKLGCVVFMYDMVGYNDSKPFTHVFLNARLRRWGLSLPTLQTWNSIRALDWLSGLPDVDAARIGCTGESGGGTQTFLLTALDERIKVSGPVVMVSDTFQGGCVCENAAGLRLGTDNVEFAAMCAPRPLIMVGASGDWTAKTMSRAYPAIRGVYSLVGSPDRVTAQVFDFPHNYNKTTRNAVYAFMARWLLGIDDSQKTLEGEQKPEKPEDLFTFSKASPAPAGRKTPEQLESYLIETMGRSLDELMPDSAGATRWEAARRMLMTSLKVRVGLVNPTPEELTSREVRRLNRDAITIVHSVVGRRSAGDQIPVVRLMPAHPNGRLTILASTRGKAVLATADGGWPRL